MSQEQPRDPSEITYKLILQEVRAGKDAVADAIKEFDARQSGIDKMMGIVVESMGRIENEMAAVRQQQFAIADGKTIAMQLRKDFDAHEANLHIDGDRVVLFDFDDCVYNWFIADIAIVLFYRVTNRDEPERVAADFLPGFLRGYAAENRLDPRWLAAIPAFLTTREIDLYAVIRRSYDLPEVTPAAIEAIPHDWPRRFMRGRRERLLAEQPYLDLDFSALADYL